MARKEGNAHLLNSTKALLERLILHDRLRRNLLIQRRFRVNRRLLISNRHRHGRRNRCVELILRLLWRRDELRVEEGFELLRFFNAGVRLEGRGGETENARAVGRGGRETMVEVAEDGGERVIALSVVGSGERRRVSYSQRTGGTKGDELVENEQRNLGHLDETVCERVQEHLSGDDQDVEVFEVVL